MDIDYSLIKITPLVDRSTGTHKIVLRCRKCNTKIGTFVGLYNTLNLILGRVEGHFMIKHSEK